VVQNSRLTIAQTLLRSTDLPLKEIAEAAGFRSAQHLSVAFRKKLATTPTQHRLEAAGAL
jgi:AraC family transcriptional regulator